MERDNSDRMRDVFRDVFDHINTNGKDAPTWSSMQRPAVPSVRQRPGIIVALATAAAVVVVLGLAGFAQLSGTNEASPVGSADTPSTTEIGPVESGDTDGVIMTMYLADDFGQSDLDSIADVLDTSLFVIEWLFVDETQSRSEARARYLEEEAFQLALRDHPDLLDPSIRVLVANPQDAMEVEILVRLAAPGGSRILGIDISRGSSATEALEVPAHENVLTEATSTTIVSGAPACAVTIPPQPGFSPPDGYPSTPVDGIWFGTADLWTTIPTQGISNPRKTVLWSTNFPGGEEEEQPEVDVTWTRIDILDEPTSNGGEATNAYTDEDGWFMIAGLDPNEPGCWQVTSTYKGATLTYVYLVPGDVSTTTTTFQTANDPLFGVELPWVLLFDDGLEGVLAIEPNERIGSRSFIAGQRPGDQPYRLHLALDHLVVGWGSVYANNVTTRASVPLGGATIFVPASEANRVWLIDYPGRRIGSGVPQVWQVSVSNGAQLSDPVAMELDGFPAIGIPGGMAIQTEAGIALWDAGTGEVVDVLGTENAFVSDVSRVVNTRLAWCEGECTEFHITTIETGEDFTITSPSGEPFDAGSARFSNDRRFLAATSGSDVVVVDLETNSTYAAFTIDNSTNFVYLSWAPFGPDLFASTSSFQQSTMKVAWHNALSRDTVIVDLPFGGALSLVVVDANEASEFLKREPNKPEACPRGMRSESPDDICGFMGW